MLRAFLLCGMLICLSVLFSSSTEDALEPYPFPTLRWFPKMPVAANNPVTMEGVKLGRYLFYDPILSADSNLSCASCHRQENAFSDAPKIFSEGRHGGLMKRNTLPLFNLAWYRAFFWDGRANSLEDQVLHPLRAPDEMNLPTAVAIKRLENNPFYRKQFALTFGHHRIDSTQISHAIAQFMRTLISYQSKFDRVVNGQGYLTQDEHEGFGLMNDQSKGDCIHCHITDGELLATNLAFSNNGLDAVGDSNNFSDKGRGSITGNIKDNGTFKVPSLRNLIFTAPFMHDGRFKTLEEVLDFYSEGLKMSATIDSKMVSAHQGGVHLTAEEKRKIIAFLHTMSDSVFVTDPAFGNPFKKR